MTADNDSETKRPTVRVAVPAGSDVRTKLLKALQQAEIDVESVPRGQDVWGTIGDQDADVVILRRSQLPPEAAEVGSYIVDDGPGLVVLTDKNDPVERVDLLAAGVSRVIDASESSKQMGEVLSVLADAAAEGGIDGPEIRGNEVQPRLADFLSRSESMRRFVELAARIADTDAALLITGETGVGKERLARAIHAEGARAHGPFVAINCGALPEQLLESQLFGHERGAFTGADKSHKGHFEQANGGTIFLDEIGEVPSHLQVKLLTVLQRHEVQRLGSEKLRKIDVRIMAATNRDLREAMQSGEFREDLFYRLNVVSLEIPPLRRRREDITDLVGLLMHYFRGEMENCRVESISEAAMAALLDYRWPGNVRELINVIERAILLGVGDAIELHDLPREVIEERAPSAPAPSGKQSVATTGPLPPNWREMKLKQVRESAVEVAERAFLDAVLRDAEGRINIAAKAAGIGTRSLYDKMRRYDLSKDDYKPGGTK